MNFVQLKNAVKHIVENSTCPTCDSKYKTKNINVIASTASEGLLETKCPKCDCSTIVTISMAKEIDIVSSERRHAKISENDVLDMKNFLNKFDGDFKKIFINRK